MGVFLLSMTDSDIKQNTISKLEEDFPHKILGDRQCLIASKDKTSSELTKELLLDENDDTYMIVKVGSYYGLQSPDVWEWLKLQADND